MANTCLQTKLTKTVVEGASPTTTDGTVRQRLYLDTELKGFGLCVGARAKSFFAQRDVNGKTVRVTIGRYGVYTVAQAREEAKELLMRMGRGVNPNREKEQRRVASLSFTDALEMHLGSNQRRAARTVSDYRYLTDQYLKDWLPRPLSEITRKDCRDRHKNIGVKYGHYVANSAFRVFRAAYNSALKIHEELGVNPSIAVDWFPEARRKAAIPSASLAEWYAGVSTMTNPIRRDYLLFVLFSGLRRENAASVRWTDVDWANRALLVPTPKSGQPFLLPLSDELIRLLKSRQECEHTKTIFGESPWVFPADSKTGHIAEPREALTVSFTIHGLRNTFITVAESLNISPYAIKMLVNHSTFDKRDVTAGYITPELERLREPMQQITDRLVTLLGGS
jgi:integrase